MQDHNISLTVVEPIGLDRKKEPVRIGMPFPKGFIKKCSDLGLSDGQGLVALQSIPLAHWPDGSIKWALLDFFAQCSANSSNTYSVITSKDSKTDNPALIEKITLSEDKNAFKIDTGVARYIIPRDRLAPFSSVSIDGSELLTDNGSNIILKDARHEKSIPVIKNATIEDNGPLRATLAFSGSFIDTGENVSLNFKSRITFFAGMSTVKFDLEIHNPKAAKHPGGIWDLGDPGSILFKELSLNLKASKPPTNIKWRTTPAEVYQSGQYTDWSIYQDSSGGENWNSTNHLDANSELTVSFKGFRIYNNSQILEEGRRATPTVRYESEEFWLEGAVSGFWQNFPKAIRIKNNEFIVSLFPEESAKVFELQGGEKKRHTVFLGFGEINSESHMHQLHNPLEVIPDADAIRTSEAFPCLIPENIQSFDYYSYVKNAIQGPNSFFSKREVIDEYGWRNFGDLYADHEAVNHKEENPLVSHYNNQYDFIYGGMLQFLSTGDHRWFELLSDAARHMIDIDIYHTDKDKSAYNHGQFWHTAHYEDAGTCTHRTYSKEQLQGKNKRYYGGGPANEQNYTSGLLHSYYLTGDKEARNAVLELAEWVTAMDDGTLTILSFIDKGPTGKASQTVYTDFHKPGRGAGNSINALLDGFRLNNQKKYINKIEELIQRCIHPGDNITELTLDEPEYRWSYLVFLQILSKFLGLKEELGEFDYIYFYARDSLIHYATWMAKNERPYKDVLHKVEIPTETWPAHDVRKSCIFYQTSRYVDDDLKKLFMEKGKYYFDRCLEDLLSFDTAYLTRPMVILIVYGTLPLWYQQNEVNSKLRTHNYKFGTPVPFIPQKRCVMNRLNPKNWFK